MDNEPRIQMWGVGSDGEGYVQDLGIYDSIEDISIHTNMFSNIKIEFEYVWDKKDNE